VVNKTPTAPVALAHLVKAITAVKGMTAASAAGPSEVVVAAENLLWVHPGQPQQTEARD
jgi:hypothetical protein